MADPARVTQVTAEVLGIGTSLHKARVSQVAAEVLATDTSLHKARVSQVCVEVLRGGQSDIPVIPSRHVYNDEPIPLYEW
jgi:hypothetical protein